MTRRISIMSSLKGSDENPFVSLLTMFSNKRPPLTIPNSPLNNFIFPCFDRQMIFDIKGRLSNGCSYPEALSRAQHLIQFDPNILLFCVDFFQEQQIESRDIILIPLSYVIYWLSCSDLSDIIPHYMLLNQVLMFTQDYIRPEIYFFCLNNITQHFFIFGNESFPVSLIPIIFERPDPQLLDTASIIISNLLKNSNIDAIHSLTDLLTAQISANPNNYMGYNYEYIVNTLHQMLTIYDVNTLGLFAALASVYEDASLLEAFFDIPRFFMARVENSPVKTETLKIPKTDSKDYFKLDTESNKNEEIHDHHNLPNDLNPPPISDFHVQIIYEDLLSDDENFTLKILFSLLSRVLQPYVSTFFEGFIDILHSSEQKEHFFELFISFLFSLDKVTKVVITEPIFSEITSHLVFLPGVSIFQPHEKFELVAFLRKSALLILAKHSPKYVGRLLHKLEVHPYLFADVIGRIHLNLDKFDLESLTDEPTLGSIIHVVSNLSTLSSQSDKEGLQKISQARSTILIFLFSIIEDASVAARCFSSSVFTRGFLGRIFDPYFHRPVILVLRQFLTKSKGEEKEVLVPTIEYICGIIDVCASMDDHEEHESVAIDLLLTVNESIIHNRNLPLKFESLITASTKYLAVRASIKFLDQTLQLYSQMLLSSPNYSVSYVQMQQLSVAIRKSDGISPSEATVCGLIGMMARSRSVNVNASFFVQEPKISILLFSTIQTKDDTMKYLSLFLQLCQHSAYNCTQCHQGELDLLLIELIKNYPNSFTFRGCKFNLIVSETDIMKYVLPLLNMIMSYESSPQVSSGIISLMAPGGDHKFPRFASEVIHQLSSTVTRLCQEPAVSLPLGIEESVFIFEGLKSTDLDYGFTFQFLLFADVHAAMICNRRPMIIQISDDGRTQIQLYVQGSSIVCRINSTLGSSFAALYTGFPSCTWTRVTLMLQQFKDNSSAISFGLNNSQPATFNLDLPPLIEGPLVVQIGGLAEPPTGSGEPIEPLCNIGAFRFYNEALDREELNELSELGSRKSDVYQTPLFCYPPLNPISISGAQSTQNQQRNIILKKNGIEWLAHDNIVENFKKPQVLRILTPFFLYFAEMPPHFSEELLDVLLCTIESKSQFPYFPLIGNLLVKGPQKSLTYSLYMKFFTFVENLNDPSLVKALVYNILMNFDIWGHSEGSHFLRVLTHWAQNLYPSCVSIVSKCFSFSDLLALARIYLWFKPIEVELIRGAPDSERPRDENLDIESCRQTYNKLLLTAATHKFTPDDARTIISHCAACQDQQQVFSILTLFLEIIQRNRLNITMPVAVCRLTYHQFKPQQEMRFINAYKVLYSMADPRNLHNYNDAIISLMNDLYFTDELFNMCSKMLRHYPCSYPLSIFIAMNLGSQQAAKIATLLAKLQIDKNITIMFKYDPNWCAYPIVLLSKLLNLEDHHNIIEFLYNVVVVDQYNVDEYLNNIFDSIDSILNTFDLFAGIFDNSLEDSARLFMTKIACNFIDTSNRELALGILLRCIKMMTLRINDPPNSALRLEFQNSPYYIPETVWLGSPQTPDGNQNDMINKECNSKTNVELHQNRSLNSLKLILNEVIKQKKFNNYQFGLVLGSDGKPLFSNLYEIMKAYLQTIDSPNHAIVFWRQTFEKILNGKLEENEKIENLISKCGSYCSKITIGNNKRNIAIIDSIRRSIVESDYDAKEALQSLDINEIAIASMHIDSAIQALHNREYKFTRDLKKLMKKSMQEDSPWSDPLYRRIGYKHSFISDSSYIMPFLNKVYNPPIPNIDPPPLPQIPKDAYTCVQIKFTKVIPSYFQFFSNHISLINAKSTKRIDFKDIKRIFIRWRYHRPNSLEFYMKNGSSIFVDFTPIEAQTILSNFNTINPQLVQTCSPANFFASTNFMKQWVDGKLSNFEYLIILNYFSGRTYNDPSMYPIYPWVVSSYNENLEGNNYHNFNIYKYRDLSKPIAAQNKEQTHVYLFAPSTPTLVSYYLSRIEPYNSIPKDMKIEKLRFTKDTFKSMQECYNRSSSPKVSNCYELTPEFFTSPFYFTGDFELPLWASDEEEFIYMHRKLLESPKVSQYLNKWIDMIFGVNSRKKGALHSENVFNTVLFSEMATVSESETLVSNLKKIGHMPAQLFHKPHPQKVLLSRQPTFNTTLSVAIDTKQEIVNATIVENEYAAIKFLAYTKEGAVLNVRLDFVTPLNRSTTTIGSIPSNLFVCEYEHGYVAIDDIKHILYIMKERSITNVDIDIRHINCLASSGSMVAAANINGEIIGWDHHDFQEHFHFCYIATDYISSMALSQKFGIVACGTSNAELAVYSYHTGILNFIIKLSAEPTKILITPEFGYILVASGSELFLVSLVGKIIRRVKIDFEIDKWTAWSCERGIDFVAISDTKNQIRMSEAFYVKFDEVFYQCKTRVLEMKYILQTRGMALITQDSYARLIPKALPF
ncbi:Beige/BEACH domain containing protein [Tritrichomonas foetus]|uniref:Beige/BEACH domain containing protein n=1 Tax=Tritrichomonas foetus TaxID=1144522 RepID=A0A1J4J7N7_9EUKA|nr:Beige/BEACH domain containing protein [Tritrichomonas foetus]|eukprot:OHS95234.1 Beige/BEACH domain containing protein [Tritrichomonas foetus]